MSNKFNYIYVDIHGVYYFIISSLFISIMVLCVRFLSEFYHSYQIVFLRNFLSIIILLPFIIKNGGYKTYATNSPKIFKLHLLRGLIGFFAMNSWFYALSQIPSLSDAVAISLTAPIFSSIAAIILLKEKSYIARWVGLIIGLLGALLIIKPGFAKFHLASIIIVFSTMSWAILNIIKKKLSETEHYNHMILHLVTYLSILTLPFAIYVWTPIQPLHLIFFMIIAFSSNLSHMYFTKALKFADLSMLTPFEFSRLIFTAIIAYIIFGHRLDYLTIVGTIIIIIGSTYVMHAETARKKKSRKTK